MSSIWTPSGEHQPDPEPAPRPGGGIPAEAGLDDEPVEMSREDYEELLRARAELAAIRAGVRAGIWLVLA